MQHQLHNVSFYIPNGGIGGPTLKGLFYVVQCQLNCLIRNCFHGTCYVMSSVIWFGVITINPVQILHLS